MTALKEMLQINNINYKEMAKAAGLNYVTIRCYCSQRISDRLYKRLEESARGIVESRGEEFKPVVYYDAPPIKEPESRPKKPEWKINNIEVSDDEPLIDFVAKHPQLSVKKIVSKTGKTPREIMEAFDTVLTRQRVNAENSENSDKEKYINHRNESEK